MGAATSVSPNGASWISEEDVARILELSFRPAFVVVFFIAGWAVNVLIFSRCHVDYAAALGFGRDEVTEPSSFLAFAVTTGLILAILQHMAFQFTSHMDVLWLPFAVYILITILFWSPCPHRLSRRFAVRKVLQRSLWLCVFPVRTHEVFFLEVLMADVLTSLAKPLMDIGVGICVANRIVGVDDALTLLDDSRALNATVGKTVVGGAPTFVGRALDECTFSLFPFALWTLPFFIRAHQCLISGRCATDHWSRSVHYANLAKYMSMLPVIMFAYFLAASENSGSPWSVFAAEDFGALGVFAAFVNTIFSAMWDLIFDWGLLNVGDGKKFSTVGLRPVLLFETVILYHIAIILNLYGRTLWSLRWSSQCAVIGYFLCTTLQQGAEVFRRCLWITFRVEWECVKRGLHGKAKRPVPSLIFV